MDIDTARHVVRQSFQIARELQSLLPFLKEHCAAAEYDQYAMDIAKTIEEHCLARPFERIQSSRIENRISAYGSYL